MCWQTSSATARPRRTCWSPAGWPSLSRSACCVRRSFSLSGSSKTSRDAGSRPRSAHEWVHFRNRDLWWIALSGLLMPILFAHPAYWWIRRRTREDQELLADAAAADGRGDYAEALLAWARQTADRPRLAAAGSVALWERPSQLKRRILMLLDRDFRLEPTCPRRWGLFVRGAMALSVLALSVLTFRPAAAGADARGPQAARESGDDGQGRRSGRQARRQPGYRGLLPVRRMLGHTDGDRRAGLFSRRTEGIVMQCGWDNSFMGNRHRRADSNLIWAPRRRSERGLLS